MWLPARASYLRDRPETHSVEDLGIVQLSLGFVIALTEDEHGLLQHGGSEKLPVATAKSLATIDRMSGGRLIDADADCSINDIATNGSVDVGPRCSTGGAIDDDVIVNEDGVEPDPPEFA